MQSIEIICSVCSKDTLLKRESIYEGFKKVGEELSCAACGHIFQTEADVPFKEAKVTTSIFTDDDRTQPIQIFNADENSRLCRYCANYVINPFVQFCSIHKKEVQATDTCEKFDVITEKRPAL